jgi:hypothetical protein
MGMTVPLSNIIGQQQRPHPIMQVGYAPLVSASHFSENIFPSAAKPLTANTARSVLYTSQQPPYSSIPERCIEKEYSQSEHLYPQLFLSHTPHHFLAVHDKGRFTLVEKRQLVSDLRGVERTTQTSLRRLREALGTVKDMVVKHGKSGRLSLVCQEGAMKVYERSSQVSCLPEDMLKKFEEV